VPESIPQAAFPLLDATNFAHVATVMEDGSPQVSPVWVARDGDEAVVFNTAKGRVKHRNIERNPQIALSVHDQDDPYTYVQVRGRAELVDEGARDHIDEMSRKYTGKDYPVSNMKDGEERVIVRVIPESVQLRG
jgi:PPOX class probable F420-dependent enzyme